MSIVDTFFIFMEKSNFLEQKYNLHNTPEAKSAAKRTEKRTGEKVPQNPDDRIQNYLNRFKEILEREKPEEKERGINALKKILINHYVVRVEDIPESYWQAQMRVARNRGEAGDWQEISEEEKLKIKQEHLAQTKEDQKGSLEEWIDYLASDASSYLPDYLKYWVFKGMLRLERYEKGDKERGASGRFPERPTGRQRSIKMFPEVNERALKFIAQADSAQLKNQTVDFRYDVPETAQQAFLDDLKKKDFRSIYGWGQEYYPPISEDEMQATDGEWVAYEENSDSKILTESLRGKGSGWCIAGEQLARQYLDQGKLNIYYTPDKDGNLTIPRVVIVERDNLVTEVRGIEWEENIDAYIKKTDIIGDKLKEIPGGELFCETDQDTKQLTAIDKKIFAKQSLTRNELIFLYEMERPIKYFGYKKDPRIEEIRETRNSEEDMAMIFEYSQEQIARHPEEVNENTKAYIGELGPGIFELTQKYNIEHVYTRFPEDKIEQFKVWLGGQSEEDIAGELEKREQLAEDDKEKIYNSSYAKGMLKNDEFYTLKNKELIYFIKLKVRDLGFPNGATTQKIYEKAEELGLDLCPPETGPQIRLHYEEIFKREQPQGEWFCIGMKQISDSDGHPSVFVVRRNDDGERWLSGRWAEPERRWDSDCEFVFRPRSSSRAKLATGQAS